MIMSADDDVLNFALHDRAKIFCDTLKTWLERLGYGSFDSRVSVIGCDAPNRTLRVDFREKWVDAEMTLCDLEDAEAARTEGVYTALKVLLIYSRRRVDNEPALDGALRRLAEVLAEVASEADAEDADDEDEAESGSKTGIFEFKGD